MHVVMLRFLGELTSQIVVDIDDKTSIPTNSGGEPIRKVARHRNIVTAGLIGDEPGDMTASGLWPSDHAGVVDTVVIPHHPNRGADW